MGKKFNLCLTIDLFVKKLNRVRSAQFSYTALYAPLHSDIHG